MKNLAGDAAFVNRKAALWDQLQAALRRQQDPRVLGNGDVFETYPYTGPRAHSWDAVVRSRK
jgi:hypothetical protein